MKKTLAIIAAAVMLLTVIVCTCALFSAYNNLLEDTRDINSGLGLYVLSYIFFYIVIFEGALFGGIALLLSKNRTPLKLILGIVIVIISAVLLIVWIRSFLGLDLKPMAYMLLSEHISGLSL